MLFSPALIEGRLIRRYKRFLADIELASGEVVVAHCPNPGSMQTCAPEGARVWLAHHTGKGRKLAYTWELVETEDALICINTSRANELVAEALAKEVISELVGYAEVRREVRYGAASRIDFLLTDGPRRCYLEVKNVTLLGAQGVSAFPDSVTTRGQKHLEELMAMVRAGHRAVLLFVCNRSDAGRMRPADAIDPVYGQLLRQAAGAGVEVLAYRSQLSPREVAIGTRVAVDLPALPAKISVSRTRARAARS